MDAGFEICKNPKGTQKNYRVREGGGIFRDLLDA